MAYARKCDRCGKYYDRPITNAYAISKFSGDIHYPSLDILDLCEECHGKLEAFMEQLMEESEDEKN